MKNEISNILNLIETGNTHKALQEAKTFYDRNENEIEAIKVFGYYCCECSS